MKKKALIQEAVYYIRHVLELSREFGSPINKEHVKTLFYEWLVQKSKSLPSHTLFNNAFEIAWQEVMPSEEIEGIADMIEVIELQERK